jgi:hypothetical protein
MLSSATSTSDCRQPRGGFALVIALSLMAFVLLLLLSITTLVRVESQSAAMTLERLRAEQNALLGLNLAIGELQKHAGRDQTVTARADLITDEDGASTAAVATSYYTGVWDTQAETFSKWLASVADSDGQLDPAGLTAEEDVNAAPSAPATIALKTMSARDPDTGSVGAVDVIVDQVAIGADGSYAYWVSDEGIKAKVDLVADETYYTALATADETDLALRTPLGAAPGIGFEVLEDFPAALSASDKRTDANFRAQLRKLGSLQDTAHFGAMEAELSLLQPDVTTYSYGLLTNPKSGGLKEDLSLAFEHGIKDSGNLFVEQDYAHPHGSMDVKGPTWSVFQDHYNLYKQMDFSNGIAELQTTAPMAHGNLATLAQQHFYKYRDDYFDPMKDPVAYERAESQSDRGGTIDFELPRAEAVQVAPVVLGSAVIVSLKIEETTHIVSADTVDRLVPVLQPVALVWNPYNVALKTSQGMKVFVNLNFGMEFRFHDTNVGSVYKGRARVGQMIRSSDVDLNQTSSETNLSIPSGDVFAPGEIKLYATDDIATKGDQLRTVQELLLSNGEGYHLTGWRKLSGAYDRGVLGGRYNKNLATRGYGVGPYDSVKSYGTYDEQGMIVEPTVERIDIALSAVYSQYSRMGIYPFLGDTVWGPFYQKRHVMSISADADEDAYSAEAEGIFSVADRGGETGTGFVNVDILTSTLKNSLTPVGVFFNSVISVEDINHGIQTPSAMELHLSANPRACFSASTVGTYAQFNNNPSTLFEAQEFLGMSTLDALFFDGKHPYFGMSYDNSVGQHRPVAWEFPLSPLTSLAQLQHVFFNRDYYEPSYAVGNSFASPYLRRNESISSVEPLDLLQPNGSRAIRLVSGSYQNWTGSAIDFSYQLNEALWDDCFFSSLAPLYKDGSEVQDLDATIDGFVNGAQVLQNSRMQLYLGTSDVAAELASDWKDEDADLSAKKVAANLMVEGAFNVNSTSVQAWKAFLGSLYEQDVVGMNLDYPDAGGGSALELNATPEGAAFSRFSLPTLDESHPSDNADIQNNQGSGYRVLDAAELDALAVELVKQVKQRGPFLSLADFVNRDLSSGTEGLMGPLQQAINDAGLNDAYAQGQPVNKGGAVPTPGQHDIFLDPEAGTGNSYGAGPGYLLQGDILNSLGPFVSVKSNTFVIRTCGESIDPMSGQTSRVYLEAVLQQVPDFVDSSDEAETALDQLSSVANQQFGRKFKLVQVRRLDPEQI